MTTRETLEANGILNRPRTRMLVSRLGSIMAFLVLVLSARQVTALTADVGVTLYGPNLDVITNDWMPYTMVVTNNGPSSALNVVATTTLPSTFGLIDASQAYSVANNVLTFNFGTMTNLATKIVEIRARPTNSGSFTLSAAVSSSGSTDPVSANDNASVGVGVGTYLSGPLTVSIVSTQKFNFLTGLTEQTIQLSNASPNTVASARIFVSGLTSTNYIYYAAGTNDGKQFIIYPTSLEPMQAANLLLQYYAVHSPFTISNSQFQAFETSLATLNPPGILGAAVPITLVSRASAGGIQVKFASTINRTYTILYSDDPAFSNPWLAPPSFKAAGTQIIWYDYGPPATVSLPTAATPRYYRVYVSPE